MKDTTTVLGYKTTDLGDACVDCVDEEYHETLEELDLESVAYATTEEQSDELRDAGIGDPITEPFTCESCGDFMDEDGEPASEEESGGDAA